MAGMAEARVALARLDIERTTLSVYIGVSCMIVALEGLPSTGALLFTMLGLALASCSGELIKRAGGDRKSMDALFYGLGLLAWATLVFGVFVNWLAAALVLTGAICDVAISRFAGGKAGFFGLLGGGGLALSTLIGWAAALGTIDLQAALPFLIVLYWAMPRAWTLADAGQETRYRLLFTTIQLCLISLLPAVLPIAGVSAMLGGVYFMSAVALALPALGLAVRQLRHDSARRAMGQFATLYLALVFCAMIGDRLL